MFYIYQILNTINGKVYIGQTNNLKRRWREHTRDALNILRPRKPIYKAIKKYGFDNFDFRIIQEVHSFQEALLCEMYWISYYQSNIIRYGDQFGYNLSDGGDGGGFGPKSKTHKENIGKANKGKVRTNTMRLQLSKSKATISLDELHLIRELLIDNVSEYTIADMFNISQGVVSDMKLGISHRYFFSEEDIILFSKRLTNKSGEKNGGAKLKEEQVLEIKKLLDKEVSVATLSKQFAISKTTIRRIQSGKSWALLSAEKNEAENCQCNSDALPKTKSFFE